MDRYERLLRWLLAAALIVSFGVLAASWNLPLLESRSFRQTQTAISAYWMFTASDWLAYPTPVVGYPWSIPFEFPLYQALALGASAVLPISLDQAGRMVSWLFAMATLWPLWRVTVDLTGRHALAALFALLYLASPLYLFGNRSFMIESTALFFSVLFLCALVRYWREPGPGWGATMVLAATCAALVKITTFFGYGVLGGVFVAWEFARAGARPSRADLVRRYGAAALAMAIALAATAAYVHMADVQKARTIWGDGLTSAQLAEWNYGTWKQKLDPALWRDIVFGRAARQILGFALLAPPLIAGAFLTRGLRGFAACLLAGYLLPYATFANLHAVHDYYQHANALCLLGLAACAIEALRLRAGATAATIAIGLLLAAMAWGFWRDFGTLIVHPRISQRTVALSNWARANTGTDEVLVIFGYDWSPEVAYYSKRRAMMVKDQVRAGVLETMRRDPARFTGAARIGAVIVCPNRIGASNGASAAFEQLLATVTARRERLRISGCDVYR